MPAHVVIAGAGIGGLTLAVALRRRGVSVTVLERQPTLRAAGAGLGLQPNAIVCLDRLGLGRAVRDAGSEIQSTAILDSTGRALGAAVDVKQLAVGLGAPVVALHRARLHETLLDAAGRDAVRTGVSVMRYESSADGVVVSCDNGERIAASLLVGADGLRSAVRAQMVGDGEPIYAGYTSWRGVTSAGAVPAPRRMSESWGRGERFGMVDIGFEQIYWFAVADAPFGGADGDVRGELLARFGGWHDPIGSIIEATPAAQILRTDISDRPPIKRWHHGRVVLLGDAAHPMTPNLGQGAGQAIEDAVVLDRCLSETASVETAFREYERQRVARANGILRASRALGTLAQWQNPAAVWFRNTALRLTPASVALSQARRMLKGTSA